MGWNLLDPNVRWVAIALGLVAVAAATVLVTLRARRRWVDVAKAVLALLVSNAVLLGSVFLYLNVTNAWYPTLADLVQGPQPVAEAHIGARDPHKTFGREQLVRTDGRRLPALPQPGQRLQHLEVSTADGLRRWPVDVLLPAGYFDPANAHRAYPVLLAAHGVPGSLPVFQGRMSLAQLTDPVVARHEVQPFIAVIPSITPGLDSECVLGPDGATQMEQWLAQDVPNQVRTRFRVMQQRTAWAWLGYSAGGWCAAMMPMTHPDRFAAGVVLGGYFRPWWGTSKPPADQADALARRLDLVDVARRACPRVALYVQTAKDDKASWPTTNAFLGRVHAPMAVTAEVNQRGGHSFNLWVPGMVRGVQWLGRTVPGFAP